MSLVLDTYALFQLFTGGDKGEKVRKLLRKETKVSISVLSLYEIGTAITKQISRKKAEEYLRSIRVYYRLLDVNEEIAMKAVELRRKHDIPAIDCLIYATAILNNAKVVSGCRHFREIPDRKNIILL
ncbi:MAG: PIN domain-containing protein [Thermoplasmata archaeon]|nr:MAG: PIN domain-containing protein [Thermoplasmata archaeon]